MDSHVSHDHWFYSVSPREKEARKQEVGVARDVSMLVRGNLPP